MYYASPRATRDILVRAHTQFTVMPRWHFFDSRPGRDVVLNQRTSAFPIRSFVRYDRRTAPTVLRTGRETKNATRRRQRQPELAGRGKSGKGRDKRDSFEVFFGGLGEGESASCWSACLDVKNLRI